VTKLRGSNNDAGAKIDRLVEKDNCGQMMHRKSPIFARIAVVVALLGLLLVWRECSTQRQHGPEILAPDAPEAPKASSLTGATSGKSPSLPNYKWPPSFNLPLKIHVDAPPVPKAIQGPTPESDVRE